MHLNVSPVNLVEAIFITKKMLIFPSAVCTLQNTAHNKVKNITPGPIQEDNSTFKPYCNCEKQYISRCCCMWDIINNKTIQGKHVPIPRMVAQKKNICILNMNNILYKKWPF